MAIFLSKTIPEGADKLMLVERTPEYMTTFPDSLDYENTYTFSLEKKNAPIGIKTNFTDSGDPTFFRLNTERDHFPADYLKFDDVTDDDHFWLRITFDFRSRDSLNQIQPTFVHSFLNTRNKDYDWRGTDLEKLPVTEGEWNQYHEIYLSPEIRTRDDIFCYYFLVR